MGNPFGWALVIHVAGVVFWIGGLLAATHALSGRSREASPDVRRALGHLAGSLLKGLAHPGAAVAIIGGIALVWLRPDDLQQGWLHIKLALVVLLIAADLFMTVQVRRLQGGRIEFTAGRAGLAHGVIALLFLAILIAVILKP